jgi:hypothetical protein
MEVAGGDMAIAKAAMADSNEELWRTLTNARKHAWKLASTIGISFLLKYLFHQLSIEDIERKAGQIIGQPGRILTDAPAEIAMDVDKPAQLELLRADLRSRQNEQ